MFFENRDADDCEREEDGGGGVKCVRRTGSGGANSGRNNRLFIRLTSARRCPAPSIDAAPLWPDGQKNPPPPELSATAPKQLFLSTAEEIIKFISGHSSGRDLRRKFIVPWKALI